MKKSDRSPAARSAVQSNLKAALPPGVSALLDVATEQRAIREARHRAASRADAKSDQLEAARLGVSTADLPPFHKGGLL